MTERKQKRRPVIRRKDSAVLAAHRESARLGGAVVFVFRATGGYVLVTPPLPPSGDVVAYVWSEPKLASSR
jgi:hypothetical protein